MIPKKVSLLFFILFIIAISFSFTNIASATPIQVIARTGQNAVDASGWTYNGLYNDNVTVALPAPMLAGELVALFASLRQGPNIPATDKGLWLATQSGTGRVVGRHGSPVPGLPTGTVFDFGITPVASSVTNQVGQLFAELGISGPGITLGLNSSAVWDIDMGGMSLIVRNTDPAIGTDPQGYFRTIANIYSLDGTLGDVGFRSLVTDLPGEPNTLPTTYGTWLHTAQGNQMMTWDYGLVPGFTDVGFQQLLSVTSGSGKSAAWAQIYGPNITLGINDSIVMRVPEPGEQQIVARTSERAPGTPEGVVFQTLSNSPAVGSDGTVVFWGRVDGPDIYSTNDTGLWKSTEQGVSLLARASSPAPAAGTGATFGGISAYSSNGTLYLMNNSDTVFATGVGGQGANLGNASAIYKISANGTHSLIARAGTTHPGFPAGATLVRTMMPLVMRSAGFDHVMFTSQLSGVGVTTANNDVLLRHSNNRGLEIVAREGQEIDGYILKSFAGNGADMQLTDNYYAVVSATFSPASNPTATPRNGILGISPDGLAHTLAVATYTISLSDGTTPTLADIRFATKSAINNSGKVVFSARFSTTPRDEAVLVAQIEGATPPACEADFNQNGTLAVDDIFSYLSAWFAQNISADTNENGTVAVDDIFAFLSLWFVGC